MFTYDEHPVQENTVCPNHEINVFKHTDLINTANKGRQEHRPLYQRQLTVHLFLRVFHQLLRSRTHSARYVE